MALQHFHSAREPLIESGANRLSCKIVQFKAQAAHNSKAIVKVCNAEMDGFTLQDAVSRFDQSFPSCGNERERVSPVGSGRDLLRLLAFGCVLIVACVLPGLAISDTPAQNQTASSPQHPLQTSRLSTDEEAPAAGVARNPPNTANTLADSASADVNAVENLPAPQFFLITIGPGPEYWSAWGHTELLVRQPGHEDVIYSYGYFDFSDEDFFSNFLKGRMRYFLDHEPAARELNRFAAENRAIWAQALNIPADKAKALLHTLQAQDTDASRYYDYDYFLSNCTSQVRDLINESVRQPFKPDWQKLPDQSWAESTLPVVNQGWLNLVLSLGYGHGAWQKRDAWQGAVFPLRLMQALHNRPAAESPAQPPRLLYPGRQAPVRFLATHGPLVFLTAFFLLALLWPRTRKAAIRTWLVGQSLIGFILLGLWELTDHRIAANNPNILLMWPLAFVLLWCSGRWCAVALIAYGLATVAWLVWALSVGAVYLLSLAGLNLIVAFLLFRSRIFR